KARPNPVAPPVIRATRSENRSITVLLRSWHSDSRWACSTGEAVAVDRSSAHQGYHFRTDARRFPGPADPPGGTIQRFEPAVELPEGTTHGTPAPQTQRALSADGQGGLGRIRCHILKSSGFGLR